MIWRNPVTVKELRSRMRGFRAFAVLMVYLGLVSGLALLIYALRGASTANVAEGSTIGKTLFSGIFIGEMLLACLIGPAFTSGAISGERERQTWDLLSMTLLKPRQIVMGKLGSAVAFLLLLLVASVPLQSLAFLMGGVTLAEIILGSVLLIVSTITFSALGLFFSSGATWTLAATLVTYAITLALLIGLPVIAMYALPVVSVFAVVGTSTPSALEASLLFFGGFLICLHPIATAVATEIMLLGTGSPFFYTQVLSGGGSVPVPSPWIVHSILYLGIAALLVALSARRVGRPER
jgi:ABC-2 type transport system permease protein